MAVGEAVDDAVHGRVHVGQQQHKQVDLHQQNASELIPAFGEENIEAF